MCFLSVLAHGPSSSSFLLSFLSWNDVLSEQVITWSCLPDLSACSHLFLVIRMSLQDLPHSAGIWLQQASIWLLHHSLLLVGIPKVSLAWCVALSNPTLAFAPCFIPFIPDCSKYYKAGLAVRHFTSFIMNTCTKRTNTWASTSSPYWISLCHAKNT